jgi:putative PIN family toxin of toxin-antitoxin system
VKVVVDTNVFVSGVFFIGPPYEILRAWRGGKLRMVVSQEILEEYSRVGKALADQFPRVNIKPVLEFITISAEVVAPLVLEEKICDDPDDDKFFSCAIFGNCNVIISGDKHLLTKSGYQGILVMKPRDFTDKYL